MNSSCFLDKDMFDTIWRQGYVVRPLFDAAELRPLKERSQAFLKEIQSSNAVGQTFLSAGRLNNPEWRRQSATIVEEAVRPALIRYFVSESIDFVAGVHQIKPPGSHGKLNPHQDSAHVDERDEFSLYVWVPLQDCDEKNGTVSAIPGSHRIGIPQRSLNIPWPLRLPLHQLLLRRAMRPIPVRGGECLFFHSALIHGSGLNLGKSTRLAVNALVKRRGSPYLHYYRDKQTPGGKVEVYSVNSSFFYDGNIQERPDSQWPLLRQEKWVDARYRLPRLYRFLSHRDPVQADATASAITYG